MVSPHTVVHKLVNGILKGLVNLLIGTLDLLTHHLHIAPEFLALQLQGEQKNKQ
jgi:hypothetical protein